VTRAESVVEVPVESAESSPQKSADEIRTFLAAISTVLHETVAAFELTVSRITEITVTRPGRADRDLVVALQDFDRLQQEFATLGQVLGKLSSRSSEEGAEDREVGHDEVIADISIADLKARLAHHLMVLTSDLPDVPAEDVEF
jgi:hypothetical protein